MTRRQAVQIIKPPVTWILVADGKQAQVYTRKTVEKLVSMENKARHNLFEEGLTHPPLPVAGMTWQAESIKEYDIAPDKLGRVQESAGAGRSMSEPRLDVHEEIREHFARKIAEALGQAHQEKSFDRLVLIAPAKMLGEIKKHLSVKLQKCIVAEMPKDLTHADGQELLKHLENSGLVS